MAYPDVDTPPDGQHNIVDIRRNNFESSILDMVIDGLSKQPKTLPALLFYSAEGLKHWNHHSHQPDFYPRQQEVQILQKHAHEIASTIAENSVVVDLGSAYVAHQRAALLNSLRMLTFTCRSLDKVILLLDALEAQTKNVTYYALDLSAEQLKSTLQAMPIRKFKHVRISALHGTFEDGLAWLKETPGICNLPHCLLLFGLTIGNFSRQNAAAFLNDIAAHALTKSGRGDAASSILVTIDSCKVPSQVLRAYNSDGVVPFALSALDYGNSLLGNGDMGGEPVSVFDRDEWYFMSDWNHILGRHEASLIPKSRDIRLAAPFNVVVSKDEKVRFGCSYKYDEGERVALFEEAGLENVDIWSDVGCSVAFYRLERPIGS